MIENVIQIKSGIMINVNVNVEIWENNVWEKGYIWNCATCSCEDGKYLETVIDNWVIVSAEIIEDTTTISINFNEKR